MKTWYIIKKDVVILLSDRKALAILILMPIILMTILGAGLSSSFDTGTLVQRFKIGIVREYESQGIEKLLEELPFADQMDIDPESIDLDIEGILFEEVLDSEEIQEIFTYEFYTREEGTKALERGEISNLVIFPEGFLRNTLINLITPFRNEVTLEVLVNPDRYIDTQITQAVFGGFEGYLNQMVAVKNIYTDLALKSGLGYAALENLETIYQSLEAGGNQNTNVTYENIEARRSIDSVEYYAMAMLSMFILFTGGQGGRMMLEEKEQYTFQRMRLSGISKWQIFLGKFVTVFIVGIVQVAIMVGYTSLILKVDWGNYFNLALVSICALLAVASMGTLIAVITLRIGNYKIANLMESFIFQVMAFLGGSFMPLEVLPKVFEKISYLTINGLALKGYLYNMQGYGLEEIGTYMVILLGITTLFTGIGLLLMMDEKRWKRAEYHQTQNAKI
jgi:ABC-2 type transport system permease protein